MGMFRGYVAWIFYVGMLRGYIAHANLHILTFLQQKYIFCNKGESKCVFHYLFAPREILNVFSEIQNALNATK